MIIRFLIAAGAAYLLGSVNTSILVGKVYGKDIREYGSGNAGLTNTVRVLGKKAAVFVLLGDILKGVAACLIASLLIVKEGFPAYTVGGLFAVAGHNWPVYFRFKGGKGALTAVSAAFMIDPGSAALLLAVFLSVLLLSRYVSLATIVTGISYPAVSYIFTCNIYILIYSALISLIVIYRHRSNISRLIHGNETRAELRSKKG